MQLILLLLAIFISVETRCILEPCQRTFSSRWTQGNLGSPFSKDPQARYPRWVLTRHNWSRTSKVFVFIFTIPVHFIHSTIKVFKYYFVFISLVLVFHIILESILQNRGSKLIGYKPLFWISVILHNPDEARNAFFCVTIPREKKLEPNQLFLIWCIWSWLIWVSIKMLITLFWFLQNLGARSSLIQFHVFTCNQNGFRPFKMVKRNTFL